MVSQSQPIHGCHALLLGLRPDRLPGQRQKLLEKTVEGVNEKCPIVVSPEIQIAKLELEEDYLTYYFDYSEQSYMLPDEIDASLKKELANQILNAISRFSGEEKEILDLLLKKRWD